MPAWTSGKKAETAVVFRPVYQQRTRKNVEESIVYFIVPREELLTVQPGTLEVQAGGEHHQTVVVSQPVADDLALVSILVFEGVGQQ